VYELAGWLTLLVACLRYDLGDDHGAEVMRRTALLLGRDLGSPDSSGGAADRREDGAHRGDWAGMVIGCFFERSGPSAGVAAGLGVH
jgi:hypothetical protein